MFVLILVLWLAWAYFGIFLLDRADWPTGSSLIYALGVIAGGVFAAMEVSP